MTCVTDVHDMCNRRGRTPVGGTLGHSPALRIEPLPACVNIPQDIYAGVSLTNLHQLHIQITNII